MLARPLPAWFQSICLPTLLLVCASPIAHPQTEPNPLTPSVAGQASVPPAANQSARVEHMNALLRKRWRDAGIEPSSDCDDRVLVRRIYLDLAGRIPSPDELDMFVDDTSEKKVEALIQRLLASEDFVQHFTDVFDALLMGRGSAQKYEQRKNSQWRAWLERVFRENRPWDEVTQEILLARPNSKEDRGLVWFLYERNDKPQEIAEAVAPAFFGVRIECAQCHDHMIADEIEQAHYWGLVAFFNRSKNVKSKWGPSVNESAVGGFSEFASLDGSSYPNHLTFLRSSRVDEPRPDPGVKQKDDEKLYVQGERPDGNRVPLFSRRRKFVDEVVRGHPLIARAFVNRVWAIVMGRGLVHPFDEMDSQHEPSHPELLDWLSEEFRRSRYDIRQLVQLIASNSAYRLKARRPDGVEDPSLFAWYLERPLTAEQYARSVQQALEGEVLNDHSLVVRVRDRLTDVLPDENVTTVKDALFLTNNGALNDFLNESGARRGLLHSVTGAENQADSIRKVFVHIFGRDPTIAEKQRLTTFLRLPGEPSAEEIQHRWKMALWAMLTSAEFRFNH